MKTLIAILISVGFIGAGFHARAVSMGHILGRVTVKETGQPLAHAEIIFENNMDKITVHTNAHGYYYSNHMPTGRYQMRIQFNERTFVMNRVRVYDSYTSEVNFKVSENGELGEVVEVKQEFPLVSSVESQDIRLDNDSPLQPSRSWAETLSAYPGIDVIGGQVFINGGGQVRFFIDGSPVIGPTSLGRFW